MERKSCFGTQLLDVSDVYCRACEAFHACQAALNQGDPSLETGDELTTTAHSAIEPNASNQRSALQSSIESAFSSGPTAHHTSSQDPEPTSHPAPDKAPGKNLVHFSTRLPEGLDVDLKVYCVLNKMTVQTFIAEAIQDRLNK